MGRSRKAIRLLEDVKKKQGFCSICRESNLDVLEFAHKHREEKIKIGGKSYNDSFIGLPFDVMKKELQKGRFLCVDCHRNETRKEDALRRIETLKRLNQDGSSYVSYNDASTHFICTGAECGEKLRIKTFRFKNSKTCKLCDYSRKIKNYTKRQEYMKQRKLEIGHCSFCNRKVRKSNSHLFDFDHIGFKNCNVSSLIFNSFEVIENEIKLCQLLCAKCHRIKSTTEARGRAKGTTPREKKNILS